MARSTPSSGPGPLPRLALAYARRRFGKELEPYALKALSRPVFWADACYEMAVERRWTAVPARLRALAVVRSAQVIGCDWCDFGGRVSLDDGLDAAVRTALPGGRAVPSSTRPTERSSPTPRR